MTKILTDNIYLWKDINRNIELQEEQQGFCKSRSCINAIFSKRNYGKLLRMWKICIYVIYYLYQAFDKIHLFDILSILKNKKIAATVIIVIKELYIKDKLKTKNSGEISNPVPTCRGIGQGEYLSLLLFNLAIDAVKELNEYRIERIKFSIICYAAHTGWCLISCVKIITCKSYHLKQK